MIVLSVLDAAHLIAIAAPAVIPPAPRTTPSCAHDQAQDRAVGRRAAALSPRRCRRELKRGKRL
jgi:hypothetical protein